MLGYLNRPDRTKEVIDEEGWFHTGDIGEMEEGNPEDHRQEERNVQNFRWEYVAPQVIEQLLKESPFIEHIMVIGENRPYPAAIDHPQLRIPERMV